MKIAERLAALEARMDAQEKLLTEVRDDVKTLVGHRAWTRGAFWAAAKLLGLAGGCLALAKLFVEFIQEGVWN